MIGIYRGKFNNVVTFRANQLGDIICDLENKGGPMKKVILAAALCGAAVALAGPANADATSDFWAVVAQDISDFLIGPSHARATSDFLIGSANADGDGDFLSGSTNALILGPTGIPTPDAAYISDAEKLYLDPNGYDGTTASTLALTTPESDDFGHERDAGRERPRQRGRRRLRRRRHGLQCLRRVQRPADHFHLLTKQRHRRPRRTATRRRQNPHRRFTFRDCSAPTPPASPTTCTRPTCTTSTATPGRNPAP